MYGYLCSCCFLAFGRICSVQLSYLLEKITLEFLKLSLNDILCFLFREKFVEEVKHCQWFQDFVSDKYLSDIDAYKKSGVFASGVGDIIVDTCANILCIPIAAISSRDSMAVTLHRPQLSQISSNSLYLAYHKYHQILSI